ncbi:hypothetical protein CWM42_25845, partial [Escherichia coli]
AGGGVLGGDLLKGGVTFTGDALEGGRGVVVVFAGDVVEGALPLLMILPGVVGLVVVCYPRLTCLFYTSPRPD